MHAVFDARIPFDAHFLSTPFPDTNSPPLHSAPLAFMPKSVGRPGIVHPRNCDVILVRKASEAVVPSRLQLQARARPLGTAGPRVHRVRRVEPQKVRSVDPRFVYARKAETDKRFNGCPRQPVVDLVFVPGFVDRKSKPYFQ